MAMENMVNAIEQYENERLRATKHFKNAEHALKYYFRKVWEKAGFVYDCDNDAEIGGIIDDIRLGIESEIKAAALLSKIPHTDKEADGDGV